MHVAEMRMLRWMCGHTRSHEIRNEVIREKMREARQMVWACAEEVRQRSTEEGVRGGGTRSRLKMYWRELIRQDMVQLHITEDMIIDRKEWRPRIRVEG
ncbi:hypothetical protein H5410_029657 [Solanum commersonii]|uniref:Uncharacterized protein n=1 Tax=Solanum commersonii TaxID=4109 RepID=A0A9J5YEL7_SOLCO|nr:hypothetical protein H5410_029657 [Solanum commersonii]